MKTETKPQHTPTPESIDVPMTTKTSGNCHEELYSALKNIVTELDRQFPDSIREPLRSLVVKADKAIAKAASL